MSSVFDISVPIEQAIDWWDDYHDITRSHLYVRVLPSNTAIDALLPRAIVDWMTDQFGEPTTHVNDCSGKWCVIIGESVTLRFSKPDQALLFRLTWL